MFFNFATTQHPYTIVNVIKCLIYIFYFVTSYWSLPVLQSHQVFPYDLGLQYRPLSWSLPVVLLLLLLPPLVPVLQAEQTHHHMQGKSVKKARYQTPNKNSVECYITHASHLLSCGDLIDKKLCMQALMDIIAIV